MGRLSRRQILLCLAALSAPLAVSAQSSVRPEQPRTAVRRIGWLSAGSPTGFDYVRTPFYDSLRQAGYEEGKNLITERGYAAGKPDRLPQVLADLVAKKAEVIIATSTVAAVAAKNANLAIPTVFMPAGAPVEIGLVKSLARPGGNMTGVAFEAAAETYAKRLQLLKEMEPRLSRVGVIHAASDANVAFAMVSLEKTAPILGVKLYPLAVRSEQDLVGNFSAMMSADVQALLVVAGTLTFSIRKAIVELAQQHRLPSMHGFMEAVADGGLASLGPDFAEMGRRGGALVGMILRGANAGDIPVELPTRYELHINLKTARALGLKLPTALLARADRVIE